MPERRKDARAAWEAWSLSKPALRRIRNDADKLIQWHVAESVTHRYSSYQIPCVIHHFRRHSNLIQILQVREVQDRRPLDEVNLAAQP